MEATPGVRREDDKQLAPMTEWSSRGEAQLSETIPESLADIWNRALLRRSQQLQAAHNTLQVTADSLSLQAEVAALFGEDDESAVLPELLGEFGPT